MNRLQSVFSAKSLAVAALALGAIGATSVAQARDDVRFTISVGQPFVQHYPARSTYPAYPVYPAYNHGHHHRPIAYDSGRGGPMGDADRDGVPNRFDRDSRLYDWRAAPRNAGYGDADRDGVPNRFDRAPYNPHRR